MMSIVGLVSKIQLIASVVCRHLSSSQLSFPEGQIQNFFYKSKMDTELFYGITVKYGKNRKILGC